MSEDGADDARLGELTSYLRAELLQLNVENVTALPGGQPPAGSRAFGVAEVSGLLITLGQSAEGLRSVVSAITAWISRGDGARRTVRLELDGATQPSSSRSASPVARPSVSAAVKRDGRRCWSSVRCSPSKEYSIAVDAVMTARPRPPPGLSFGKLSSTLLSLAAIHLYAIYYDPGSGPSGLLEAVELGGTIAYGIGAVVVAAAFRRGDRAAASVASLITVGLIVIGSVLSTIAEFKNSTGLGRIGVIVLLGAAFASLVTAALLLASRGKAPRGKPDAQAD